MRKKSVVRILNILCIAVSANEWTKVVEGTYCRDDGVPFRGKEVGDSRHHRDETADDHPIRRGLAETVVRRFRKPDDEHGTAYHQQQAAKNIS